MLCVSLGEMDVANAARMAVHHELVEFRLDSIVLHDARDIPRLFSSHPNAIATCRPGTRLDRAATLLEAIQAGARFVDVERESDPAFLAHIRTVAREYGCTLIVSHHDFEGTPSQAQLEDIREDCWRLGADICKIATFCRTAGDALRLLMLLEREANRTVAVGMGCQGAITRVAALPLGSPFTLAAPDEHQGTAPGQLSLSQMENILKLMGYAAYAD